MREKFLRNLEALPNVCICDVGLFPVPFAAVRCHIVHHRTMATSGEYSISKNRRRLTRVEVELPAAMEREGEATVPVRISDVGVGGVFIESDTVPAYGSRLTLVLYVSGLLIRVPAVVRWADERGFGVQFEVLEPESSKAILRAVADAS